MQPKMTPSGDTPSGDTPPWTTVRSGRFSRFVQQAASDGRLIVQPRMGFGPVPRMRAGLEAVRAARCTTVGTITVDSYTRVNDHKSARQALHAGDDLNGFPLVTHGAETTRQMLFGLADDDFPVQVRHGSAIPDELFAALVAAGADATEGGPVSYCLPYSRVPLREAVASWARCCELLAGMDEPMHVESFGGCMLGQLCPPSMLVALTILEGLFFREHGLRDISLSYAQQTHPGQDLEALAALRSLAGEWLGDLNWHVVLYTYMGVFPRTPVGAFRILEESARLAVRSGTERLIVKTQAEAMRIPSIGENVAALEFAAAVAENEASRAPVPPPSDTGILDEARLLITTTLQLGSDVGSALLEAFASGHLDVPFCLHRDNANRARARIDHRGQLVWSDTGALPLTGTYQDECTAQRLTARGLVDMLGYNERRFDREQLVGSPVRRLL